VSRKDYETPEVREAIEKEMKNLQEHGTYEEVRREKYMSVIPSLWVIDILRTERLIAAR
jgi:biotin operon repressor